MKRSAVSIFGVVMMIAIAAWDIDAMRPHVAAHSWLTLGYVSLFLVTHVCDYFTAGQIIDRLPAAFTI
jgi:hypothetical protein